MTAAVVALFAAAAVPDVGEIMRRVAESQETALDARRQWSYQQFVRVRLNPGRGRH